MQNNNQRNNARLSGKRAKKKTHGNPQTIMPAIRVDEDGGFHKKRWTRVNRSFLYGMYANLNKTIYHDHKLSKPRTLADMTPEERAKIEERYGAKIKP